MNKSSRRKFLRQAAVAGAAAFAAPTIIPISVYWDEMASCRPANASPWATSASVVREVDTCWGALGLMSPEVTQAAKDVQVLAVCDVRRERRETACDKVNNHYAETYGKAGYKPCQAYNDFRDVLDRPDIDAVLIATPAHWHATLAELAAEAGKDIYCEKPTAVTVREKPGNAGGGARRYGRVYQAGTQQRSEYGGKFRMACEFIRSGRIGKLKEIYAYRDGGGIFWPKRFGPDKAAPAVYRLGLVSGTRTVDSFRRQCFCASF